MITQAERDYVVDLFFTISPYAKNSKDKEEIVDDFLFETMSLRGFLLEINRNYSIKDFIEEMKKFYNGQSCLEDKEGIIMTYDEIYRLRNSCIDEEDLEEIKASKCCAGEKCIGSSSYEPKEYYIISFLKEEDIEVAVVYTSEK